MAAVQLHPTTPDPNPRIPATGLLAEVVISVTTVTMVGTGLPAAPVSMAAAIRTVCLEIRAEQVRAAAPFLLAALAARVAHPVVRPTVRLVDFREPTYRATPVAQALAAAGTSLLARVLPAVRGTAKARVLLVVRDTVKARVLLAAFLPGKVLQVETLVLPAVRAMAERATQRRLRLDLTVVLPANRATAAEAERATQRRPLQVMTAALMAVSMAAALAAPPRLVWVPVLAAHLAAADLVDLLEAVVLPASANPAAKEAVRRSVISRMPATPNSRRAMKRTAFASCSLTQ